MITTEDYFMLVGKELRGLSWGINPDNGIALTTKIWYWQISFHDDWWKGDRKIFFNRKKVDAVLSVWNICDPQHETGTKARDLKIPEDSFVYRLLTEWSLLSKYASPGLNGSGPTGEHMGEIQQKCLIEKFWKWVGEDIHYSGLEPTLMNGDQPYI